MNYSRQFYDSLRVKMMEERKNFLDEAHTKEKEVKINHRKGFNRNREFFDLDYNRVWMPSHLQYVQKYKRYLFSME